MQTWLPWAIVLTPGGLSLCLAVWSLLSEGWDDASMVEALQDLSLHSVFYAPTMVAAVMGLFMPVDEVKKLGIWIGLASIPVMMLFFMFGLRCIVRRSQIERRAEQEAERRRLEDDK